MSKQTTQDLFQSRINSNWELLRKNQDTIFENIQYSLNAEDEFRKFKKNHDGNQYMELVAESSLYTKKKLVDEYFWSTIVGDLYESTVRILEEAGLIEEAKQSFNKSYKIENTARLILENGVFVNFGEKRASELAEFIINETFYPDLNDAGVLEEGFMDSVRATRDSILSGVVASAKLMKSIMMLLTFVIISPVGTIFKSYNHFDGGMKGTAAGIGMSGATVGAAGAVGSLGGAGSAVGGFMSGLGGTASAAGASYGTGVLGTALSGLGGIGAVMGALASPAIGFGVFGILGYIWRSMNTDLIQVSSYLQKINSMGNNEHIEDLLRGAGTSKEGIVKKCWDKNKHQRLKNIEGEKVLNKMVNTIGNWSNGINNFLRDPLTSDPVQIALVLKDDASDPKYQKMFYDFRICFYEKLFEIIQGYATAIYSVDDSSYEVIKFANDVHKRKNFKAFFKLDPKEDGEIAMFKIIKMLIAIEEIVFTLKKHKSVIVGDLYIDKFIQTIEGYIKVAYQQLEELANQRSYNKSRYNIDEPTDAEKAIAIEQAKTDQKVSIFS